MVPGAEGHGGLDQQRLAVFGHLVDVMAAVNEEAARLDGRQLPADMGDPVGLGQFGDGEVLRPHRLGKYRQRCGVRLFLKVATDLPKARAVLDLEHAHAGGFGAQPLHRLAQSIGGVAAFEGGQGGERGHGAVLCCGAVAFRLGPRARRVKPCWVLRLIRRPAAGHFERSSHAPARDGAGSAATASTTPPPCPQRGRIPPPGRPATTAPEARAERPRRCG